jgi:16S rRNA processing protein RimM
VSGDVVVEPYTDALETLLGPGSRLIAGDARGDVSSPRVELRVAQSSPFQDGLIVHFEEIGDRDVADRWRDRFLLVPSEELPPPAEGEIHIHDLVGLRVVDRDGTILGSVDGFYELPQGLMLDVKGPDGEFLLPYRDEFVLLVDREASKLVVNLPEGFLE